MAEQKVDESAEPRVLEFRCESLLEAFELVREADIVVLQTNFYEPRFESLMELLGSMQVGARLLSYKNLNAIYAGRVGMPFRQLAVNVSIADTFATSWSPQHHFYLYTRI